MKSSFSQRNEEGTIASKKRNVQFLALGLRTPYGMVTHIQNFRSLACMTAVCRALKVFAKRYIMLKTKVSKMA